MSAPQNPATIYKCVNEQWLFWEREIRKNEEARKKSVRKKWREGAKPRVQREGESLGMWLLTKHLPNQAQGAKDVSRNWNAKGE